MYFITFNYSQNHGGRTTIGTEFSFGEISERQQSLTTIPMGFPHDKTLKHPESVVKEGFATGDIIFPVTKASVDALREFLYQAELLAGDSGYLRSAPYYHGHNPNRIDYRFETPDRLPRLADGRCTQSWRVVNDDGVGINAFWERQKDMTPPDVPFAKTSCWTGALFLIQDIAGVDLSLINFEIPGALSRIDGAAAFSMGLSKDKDDVWMDLVTDSNIHASLQCIGLGGGRVPPVFCFGECFTVGADTAPEVIPDIPLEILISPDWACMERGSGAAPLPAMSKTLWGRGSPIQYRPALVQQSLRPHHG